MNFDQAKLAIVAYAQVVGTDGSSTLCNSGVVTARTTIGAYSVTLPVALQQPSANDVILVTPISTSLPYGLSYTVDNSDATTKYVYLGDNSTGVDCDFSVVIMRSLLSGSPK